MKLFTVALWSAIRLSNPLSTRDAVYRLTTALGVFFNQGLSKQCTSLTLGSWRFPRTLFRPFFSVLDARVRTLIPPTLIHVPLGMYSEGEVDADWLPESAASSEAEPDSEADSASSSVEDSPCNNNTPEVEAS